MKNSEDHFNESLIIFLNGQQDLQMQALNMMQDITHRHGSDNLMRGISNEIFPYMMEKIWN